MRRMDNEKRIRGIAFLAAVILLAVPAHGAAAKGEYEQRPGESMSLLNVFPGLRQTSVPVTIVVDSERIPDGAVVESISVHTGRVARGNKATALNVVESYNLLPPGKDAAIGKKWAGARLPTTFIAGELGGDVPVKGVWRLSMTGTNVGRSSATTIHPIARIVIVYRVPEK